MPSSTSSSEPRRIPAGRWRDIWVVALALAAIGTLWCEHVSRAHGQRTSIVDDPVWWSLFRRTVDDDRRVVAFVGTSRMELAYSGAAFAAAAPELRGVQLAINGITANPVLEDLAADEHFRGIAVVDMDEWDIYVGDVYAMARPYIRRSHALWRAPSAVANRVLASLVQDRLAVLAVGGRTIASRLIHGKWPAGTWVASDRDRISHGDYSAATRAALDAKAVKRLANFADPPPPPAQWLERAAALEPLVARIRAHGGDVVIVRLPVSGRLAAGFDRDYPRAAYWDAFAAHSTAHVLHFRDIAAQRDLICPDEMHLDQRDQATWTRSLVDELRARGVLANR